jgi:hypothetical protein
MAPRFEQGTSGYASYASYVPNISSPGNWFWGRDVTQGLIQGITAAANHAHDIM